MLRAQMRRNAALLVRAGKIPAEHENLVQEDEHDHNADGVGMQHPARLIGELHCDRRRWRWQPLATGEES